MKRSWEQVAVVNCQVDVLVSTCIAGFDRFKRLGRKNRFEEITTGASFFDETIERDKKVFAKSGTRVERFKKKNFLHNLFN